MKSGAIGALDAVDRPPATVGSEVGGHRRVPVTRDVNRHLVIDGILDVPIERLHNMIAARHRECAISAEIILDVDNQ